MDVELQAVEPQQRVAETLERLLVAHETWFDVERYRSVAGKTFAGFAAYHESAERYVLSKRAKLWEVATNEYLFFETVDRLDEETLAELVAFMKTQALGEVVRPHPDHMCSNLDLVVLAGTVAPGVERAVRSVRFRKNWKLGIWGWSDLRVAVVDLATAQGGRQGRVMTNAAGKVLRTTLESNLCPAAYNER